MFKKDQAEGLRYLSISHLPSYHESRAERFPTFFPSPSGREVEGERTKMITIISNERGVGQTTLILNLAAALSNRGLSIKVLNSFYQEPENLFFPQKNSIGIQEEEAKKFDFIFIDTKSYPSQPVKPLTDNIIIVTSTKADSIINTYALIKTINQNNRKSRFKVLINKVGIAQEAVTIFNNLASTSNQFMGISLDFLGFIPHDENVCFSTKTNESMIKTFPHSSATICLQQCADHLLKDININTTRNGISNTAEKEKRERGNFYFLNSLVNHFN